jgi:hypothetical protein
MDPLLRRVGFNELMNRNIEVSDCGTVDPEYQYPYPNTVMKLPTTSI